MNSLKIAYWGELLEQGTDPLKIMVDFCKKNDIEIFWTIRMNDIHDAYYDSIFDFNEFKKAHPEYLVGTKEDPPRFGPWSAVDYGHEKVRELSLRYIEEVCQNYDIDGIELDFMRHETYFKRNGSRYSGWK